MKAAAVAAAAVVYFAAVFFAQLGIGHLFGLTAELIAMPVFIISGACIGVVIALRMVRR